MKWFKFYGQDWHLDPKINSMSMEDRLCLLALFTIASSEGRDGFIPFLDESSLIKLAGIPDNQTKDYNPRQVVLGVLKRYEALRIVTLGGNGEVTVRNWGVRQGGNTSNAEKQKRYRERLKIRLNDSGNVTVTQGNERCNALHRIEEIRIDNSGITNNSGKPRLSGMTDLSVLNTPKKNHELGAKGSGAQKNKKLKTPKKDPNTPINFQAYLKAMHDHPQRHVQIIAFYFEEKKLKFDKLGQLQTAVKRHLRDASALVAFSDEQLVNGAKLAAKDTKDWTLGTLIKSLTK